MQNEPVYVINNLESVVEVFLDEANEKVIEKKRLNGNRYKTYTYKLKEYLHRNKNREVSKSIQTALN